MIVYLSSLGPMATPRITAKVFDGASHLSSWQPGSKIEEQESPHYPHFQCTLPVMSLPTATPAFSTLGLTPPAHALWRIFKIQTLATGYGVFQL